MSSEKLERPVVVDAPPKEKTAGVLVSSIREGEMFVRGQDRKIYRLVWKRTDVDRRRSLPEGSYRLMGYRIVLRDDQGARWFISTTSKGYRGLYVRAGSTARVDVPATVDLRLQVRREEDEVHASASLTADPPPFERIPSRFDNPRRSVGLSIYREGKRIPLRFRAVDGSGEIVVRGVLKYG